jgi:hypothetical protein
MKIELQNVRIPKINTAIFSRRCLRPTVKIFVVYELETNRKRVESMQQELSRRLGRSFTFSVSWWSLKSLSDACIRNVAASFVAGADILCFSLVTGGVLPDCVTKWIDKLALHGETFRPALLALVESGGVRGPQLSHTEVYLSHLATAAKVDCLCYSDGKPATRTTRVMKQENRLKRNAKPATNARWSGFGNHAVFSAVASPSRPAVADDKPSPIGS